MSVASQPRSSSSRPWFRRFPLRGTLRERLIAFHHAGGSASAFRTWPAGLPEGVEVVAIQLPGRDERIVEAPHCTASSLVPAITAAIEPLLDRPFTFFGHSMGALLAFEVVRALRRRSLPAPRHLLVSGRGAPHTRSTMPALSAIPTQELFDTLGRLGGIPCEVLANRELLALVEPAVRADLAVCESYRFVEDAPLATPITAYGGVEDTSVPEDSLRRWQIHTDVPLRIRMFPGDHFFIASARDALHADISGLLQGRSRAA